MVSATLLPLNSGAPWRDGPATFELAIMQAGDVTAKILDTAGVSASWQVSGTTTLSAEVKTETLIENYGTTDLRAYWLKWEHPTLGVWAGEISEVESDLSTGTTEIAARDFSALLEARRIAKVYDVAGAPAGALAKRVIVDAGREMGGYSWIRNIYAEETGDQISVSLRGGKVLDALKTLSSRSGDEFWVDELRQLWWQKRRGTDLTATRTLVQGRHIVGGRYSLALGPIVNDLQVVPADKDYALTQAFIIDDDTSIAQFGRRQDTLIYTGMVTESTLMPIAKKDLTRLKGLGDTVRLDVVNVDGCFAWFGDGDVIRVSLPSVNRTLEVRVLVRTYDTDSGVLRLSGDVEAAA